MANFLPFFLHLLLASVVLVAGQGDGINFCDDSKNNSCFCETSIEPVQIICEGISLKVLYEESDWIKTLGALNVSEDRKLEVSFSNNHIEDVPRFPKLNIVMLYFHKNYIRSIAPSAFADLTGLDTLDLSYNNLTSDSLYEGVFYGPFNSSEADPGYFPLPVKHLNMSHNRIHSLEADLMDHFTSLKTLDLGFNPLKVLSGSSSTSGAISSLRKLESLGLRHTRLSSISDGMLHDLIHLVALDLSDNKFTEVPGELQYAHNLTVLDLDGNKFEKLDKNSFIGLDYLEDLSISNIHTLKEIDNGTFAPLKRLNKLEISYNRKLTKLHNDAFLGLTDTPENWPVKEIRLNDNGLTHIDAALAPWEYVDYVDIQSNPFRCDCNLDWMVSTLVDRIRRSTPIAAVDLTCAEPKAMKGKSLEKLADDPDLFSHCQPGGTLRLDMDDFDSSPDGGDPFKSAGLIALLVGMTLIIIGLSILGFIFVKRRAIAQALHAPSQIRYERADTEEDEFGEGRKYTGPSSIFK